MGKFRQLYAKLLKVNEQTIDKELLRILKVNQAYVIDLNTEQLFTSGRDSEGNLLEPYHSSAYAEFKLHLNPSGVVDLKLTGSFYKGFFINTDKFPILFDSKDEKSEMLKEKYGKEIFGLDSKSKENLVQHIKEQVQDFYRKLLQL